MLGAECREWRPDVVCMSWCAGVVPHRQALTLASAIPHDIPLVVGGHGPSGAAEWYREHLRPEGGVVEVVEGTGRSELLGIDCDCDPDEYDPTEVHGEGPEDYYPMVRAPRASPTDRVWPVLSAVGCPGRCTFCFRLRPGHRPRCIDRLHDEVEDVVERHDISYVQVQDECGVSTSQRGLELADMFGHLPVRWSTQARVTTIARGGRRLTDALAVSECVFVNLGIESLNTSVLRRLGKAHDAEQAEAAVRYLRESGITPGLNLLWPLPGADLADLEAEVAFIERWTDDHQLRTIRPPTPWPGCALWHDAVAAGVWRDAGEFYSSFTNADLYQPGLDYAPGLSTDEVNAALSSANERLVRGYYARQTERAMADLEALHSGRHDDWTGWRRT